jgi:hypothetical protein
MMKKKYKRKKGPVRSKKVTFDGITFASGLEKYMYIALKKAKIYFISPSFIIECKGRANESFPIRWKMFKKFIKNEMPYVTLYKPQNQKECDKVVDLIIKKKKNK